MVKKAPPKPAAKKKPAPPCPRRTNNDLYGLLLDVKSDLLTVKEDIVGVKGSIVDLSEHVNHEVEALNDAWLTKLDGKLDDAELLTAIGSKLLNNPWFRWAGSAMLLLMLADVAYAHWLGPISGWAEFILRVVFNRIV